MVALHRVQRHGIVPGQTGDHGIRVAAGNHDRAPVVAVVVDHALAVAQQVAAPLQAAVKILRIVGLLRSDRRAFWIEMPGRSISTPAWSRHVDRDLVLAADQDRLAQALRDKAGRRADHRLFLAFGKDDAFRLLAHLAEKIRCSVPATGSRRADSWCL